MFLRMELWARRIVLAVAALAAIGSCLIPVGAKAETPILSPQAWCALADPPVAADISRADSVMNGKIDLGKFGTYSLTEDPDWSFQSTTDLAGNRGVNSLEWISPVIQQGLARNDSKMLARARSLIYDWSADHPVTRTLGDSDQPLISGKRIIALNCAGEMLNDPVVKGIALAEANRMQDMTRAWGVPNNTDLVGYTGLLFNACFVGDQEQKSFAEVGLNDVAKALVNRDGSDIEGSPAYANYTVLLFNEAIKIMSACNINSDVLSTRRKALLEFISYTIRPNFTWETIGDSTAERLTTYSNPQPSPLYWAASKGNGGTAPTNTYSVYPDGGYLFARSQWSPTATFYSLRAQPKAKVSPHAHNDATSFTLFSQGVQWIGDPGPYRYDKSLVRDAITKRAAHSALEVQGTRTARKGGFSKVGQNQLGDMTCVRDNPHPQITMTRCVQYIRATDIFVITDRFIDKRKAKSLKVSWMQRWQIPPGVSLSPLTSTNGFLLTSGAAGMELATDSGARLTLNPGGIDGLGLFTSKYGELLPGNTIVRRYDSRGKSDVTVVTTLRPVLTISNTAG